jgi:hypothetical protein
MVEVNNNGKSIIWKYDKDEWKLMVKKSKELKPPFFTGYTPKMYFNVGEPK